MANGKGERTPPPAREPQWEPAPPDPNWPPAKNPFKGQSPDEGPPKERPPKTQNWDPDKKPTPEAKYSIAVTPKFARVRAGETLEVQVDVAGGPGSSGTVDLEARFLSEESPGGVSLRDESIGVRAARTSTTVVTFACSPDAATGEYVLVVMGRQVIGNVGGVMADADVGIAVVPSDWAAADITPDLRQS